MIVVVLNTASGLASRPRLRDELRALWQQAGVDAHIHDAHEPHHIRDIARQALDARADVVVAGGGDSTVSAVASVLAGTNIPLGVLPLGTLNHFAKDLGIPLDAAKAVEVIRARHVQRIDVGRVNDRIFVNNCSLGVYPNVLEIRERLRRDGHRKWTAFGLAMLEVLRRGDEVTIRLDARPASFVVRTPFVLVGNNEYCVEGIKLGSRPRLDNRRLYAYFAPPVRTRYLPAPFAHALVGLAHDAHTLASISAAELWIDTPSPAAINLACDGELLAIPTPLHCRSWPGALNVLAPPSERS